MNERDELILALERAIVALEFIKNQEDGNWLEETIKQCRSAILRSLER